MWLSYVSNCSSQGKPRIVIAKINGDMMGGSTCSQNAGN